MPESVPLQETLVQNGRGERIIPIYICTIPVPRELFLNEALNQVAYKRAAAAADASTESSNIHQFKDLYYELQIFYVSSPNRAHTQSIATELAAGFGLDILIEE